MTGTISHECLLSGRLPFSPALGLVEKFFPEGYGIPTSESVEIAADRPFMNAAKLINYLIQSSYSGLIGDPIHAPVAFADTNIRSVCQAFISVIDRHLLDLSAERRQPVSVTTVNA